MYATGAQNDGLDCCIKKHAAVSTAAYMVVCIVFLYLKSKKIPLHSIVSLRVLVVCTMCVKWARSVTLTPTNQAHHESLLLVLFIALGRALRWGRAGCQNSMTK